MEEAQPVLKALERLNDDRSIESATLLEAYNEILADLESRIEGLQADLALAESRG